MQEIERPYAQLVVIGITKVESAKVGKAALVAGGKFAIDHDRANGQSRETIGDCRSPRFKRS